MDFTVSADPPHVVEFRKEVAAWLAEQFKGYEHLRWSASWSTREDAEEYKFRRGLAEKLGAKGWLFPLYPKNFFIFIPLGHLVRRHFCFNEIRRDLFQHFLVFC